MTLLLFLMGVPVLDLVFGFDSVVLHSAEHFFEKSASTGLLPLGEEYGRLIGKIIDEN